MVDQFISGRGEEEEEVKKWKLSPVTKSLLQFYLGKMSKKNTKFQYEITIRYYNVQTKRR